MRMKMSCTYFYASPIQPHTAISNDDMQTCLRISNNNNNLNVNNNVNIYTSNNNINFYSQNINDNNSNNASPLVSVNAFKEEYGKRYKALSCFNPKWIKAPTWHKQENLTMDELTAYRRKNPSSFTNIVYNELEDKQFGNSSACTFSCGF